MKTKILNSLLFLFFWSVGFTQNSNVINWLKINAIPLNIKDNKTFTFCENVHKIHEIKVFGFVEATNHHSEFFRRTYTCQVDIFS